MTDRLEETQRRFDVVNRQDPVLEPTEEGPMPRDYLYGVRMSKMLFRLVPSPSEALQLAVRAQHLGRFEVPRDTYPKDRAGYHRWRNRLKKHHSDRAAEILTAMDYDDASVQRIRALIEKRDFKHDPEAQTLEDVACLVFLHHQLEPFASQHSDEKMIVILSKSLKKMSDAGRQFAMTLSYPLRSEQLIQAALAGDAR